MLKRLFSSVFNSSDNTVISKTESDKGDAGTLEERLSKWLSHPAEYNQRPGEITVIDSGTFALSLLIHTESHLWKTPVNAGQLTSCSCGGMLCSSVEILLYR